MGHLQKKGGFSDARLAADQDGAAGDDTPAQDAVELAYPARPPRGVGLVDLSQGQSFPAAARSPVCPAPEPAGPRASARASAVGALYSSRLSHVPQSGHLPIHLGCTEPQWLHKNCMRVFAINHHCSSSSHWSFVRKRRRRLDVRVKSTASPHQQLTKDK